jgi:hypothetical protein
MVVNIGFFGSCQLHLCCNFFFNKEVLNKNNFKILLNLPFYEYDEKYIYYKGILDYKIFDELDILVIENNNLNNNASSKKIINYCKFKNTKIIKTFLLKFPIYPINWSGYGENKNDYLNWKNLDEIDYKKKFEKTLSSFKDDNLKSDISLELTNFVKNNYNKQLLFTHSLHPTNILLYELYRSIFDNLNINIDDYKFIFNCELILFWINPFTKKMYSDLKIEFENIIDDNFYINRYNENKLNFV